MNFGRLYQLFVTHLKFNTRNRTAFFFIIIFPLIFIGVFGIAFQDGDPSNTTIEIGLINKDEGIPDDVDALNSDMEMVTGTYFSKEFISILSSITFQDNTTKIFEIKEYDIEDEETAFIDVERRDQKALVILNEDFSLGVLASIRQIFGLSGSNVENYPEENYVTSVELHGDQSLLQFGISSAVVEQVVSSYFSFGEPVIGASFDTISNINTEGFTVFDFIVPGLFVFAIINNMTTVAIVSIRDVKTDLLGRLRLSKMKPWEYLSSLLMSQLVISFIQIPILFGTAILFGFPFSTQIFYAFIFTIFLSLGMSGMGIILASIAKDESSVNGLANVIATPMAFLAGAFFPMPNPTILPSFIGGRSLGLFDLLPPTSAISGLRLILISGWSFSEVWVEFLMLVVLSLTYLAVGLYLYSRKHLSPR